MYRERLVAMAETGLDADLARHVESCSTCAALLARYQRMHKAAKQEWVSAPSSLIGAAKAMLPSTRRAFIAGRLGTSLLAGARGVPEEFQLVAGTEELPVRLLASREDNGWHVMGRFPAGNWAIESSHPAWIEEGGFRLLVPSLRESEFTLVGADETLEFPSIETLLEETS